MTNYTRKAVMGFGIIFIMTIIGAVAGYLFRVVLAKNLTVSDYGLFFAIYSFMFMAFILKDLGLGQATSKFIPEAIAANDFRKVRFIVIFSFLVTISISIILLVLTVLGSHIIANYYLKMPLAAPLVRLFGLIFFFFAIEALIVYVISAFQKHKIYAFFQVFRQVLALIFLFLFFMFSVKIEYALLAYLLTSIVTVILFIFMSRRIMPEFFNSKYGLDKNLSKNMLKFGVSTLLISIGGLVLQSADSVMLTIFKTTQDVGIYNAAVPIANLLLYIGSALSVVLIPLTSELMIKKMSGTIKIGIMSLYKYSFMILLPLVCIGFMYAGGIITILFGSAYVSGALALQILLFGTTVYLLAQMNFSILSGIGEPQITARILIIGTVVNILLNLYLIPKWGIAGAALTTSASYLIMAIMSTLYVQRKLRLKFPLWHWVKSLVISLIMIGTISYLKHVLKLNLYLEIAVLLVIGAVIYIALSFILSQFNWNEIKTIINLIKSNKSE